MGERPRRLAAIMFTEMIGFTAMAQADEAQALRVLDDHNRRLRAIFPQFRGREVKTMGDAFLVDFGSALDATACAVEIQRQLTHPEPVPSERVPYRLRIGIHLGDVVYEGDDVLGDAVNLASRMQPLADPGGICVSGAVYDQVRNKIDLRFQRLDPRSLRHVRLPVDVYRVELPWEAAAAPIPVGARHRLAVLPFVTIGDSAQDAYLADGMTEELIGTLCQLRQLRVIARGSVAPYRSTSKSLSEIAGELGVGSIVEGSIRRSGNRVRISCELVDAQTEERRSLGTYDRELGDILAIQAEIAREVAAHLRLELGATEEAHVLTRPPISPDSYLAYLQGRSALYDRSRTALETARADFERAIAIDPQNAAALSGLADVLRLLGTYRHLPPGRARELSREAASRAVEADPNLAEAHASLGLVLHDDYRFGPAEEEFRLALSRNPSYAYARHSYALLLEDEGRADEAQSELALAQEADPRSALIASAQATLSIYRERFSEGQEALDRLQRIDSGGTLYRSALAILHFVRSEFGSAREILEELRVSRPGEPWVLGSLGAVEASMGNSERAREILHLLEGLAEDRRSESDIAEVYAHLRELDHCFRWLEAGVENRDVHPGHWILDPTHAHVVRDPRFRELLRRMNLG